MSLIVGAPVFERGWILQDWFDHLAVQEDHPSQEIDIVFVYGSGTDDTLDIIKSEQASGRWNSVVVIPDNEPDHVGPRFWTLDRYATMVRLRNCLLNYVRGQNPDYFLSCDTDMLLPPHTLRTLFENFGEYEGIAPLTWMTEEGPMFPNCMALDGSRPVAPTTTQRQYAVFGTVLMSARLYGSVDYELHGMGEDLGWAKRAWEAQIPLAICPDVRVKHVMRPDLLGTLDPRVGF